MLTGCRGIRPCTDAENIPSSQVTIPQFRKIAIPGYALAPARIESRVIVKTRLNGLSAE
jgi:hypothetical protein